VYRIRCELLEALRLLIYLRRRVVFFPLPIAPSTMIHICQFFVRFDESNHFPDEVGGASDAHGQVSQTDDR